MAQWALSTFKYLQISQCSQVALIAFIQIMRYFTHVGYVQNKKKCSHGSLLCLQFPLSQTTAELKNVSQFWTAYYVLLLSKDDQDIYISGGRTELQYRLKHMISLFFKALDSSHLQMTSSTTRFVLLQRSQNKSVCRFVHKLQDANKCLSSLSVALYLKSTRQGFNISQPFRSTAPVQNLD